MEDEKLRAEGAVDKVKGEVKQGVGHATGDHRTEAEGKLDELKGNLKEAAADIGDKVEDVVNDIKRR